MKKIGNNFDVYTNTDEARNWYDRALKPLDKDENVFIMRYILDKDASLLDSGCGAGRIAFNLEQIGFSNVSGFDFSESMIAAAEAARPLGSKVNFCVTDASVMANYKDMSFTYLLYLQQLISLIPFNKVGQLLSNAYRVAKPGGFVLFSALNIQGRPINNLLSSVFNLSRLLWREPVNKQMLPWLKYGSCINWKFLGAGQSTCYWFYKDELEMLLKNAGFDVLEITTTKKILNRTKGPEGNLYAACIKK